MFLFTLLFINSIMANIEKDEVQSWIKEGFQEARNEAKKEFSEPDREKVQGEEKSTVVENPLKAVVKALNTGVKSVHTKSLTDGGATTGAPFVPEEFSQKVWAIIGQYGIINKFTRYPMLSDTMNVPTITVNPTAYVVSEGSAITASDLTSANLQLATKKVAHLGAFSNEWLNDSYPIETTIVPVIADAIAKKIESVVLSGSPTFTRGVLNGATVGVTAQSAATSGSFGNFVAKDFVDMIGALEAVDPTLSEGAMFIMNPLLYNQVRSLTGSNAQYIFVDAIAGNPPTILGYPVYRTLALPSTPGASKRVAAFGNPKYVLFGDRAGMTMTLGNEGTVGSDNLFEKDMSAIRTIVRLDGQLALTNSFSYLECKP